MYDENITVMDVDYLMDVEHSDIEDEDEDSQETCDAEMAMQIDQEEISPRRCESLAP